MIPWLLVVAAGLLEAVWAGALKKSDGARGPAWALAGLAIAMVSLVLLSLALSHLPVGTAYAVWVGVGAGGVALTGLIAFKETFSPLRVLSLVAVIIGIAGLHATGEGG